MMLEDSPYIIIIIIIIIISPRCLLHGWDAGTPGDVAAVSTARDAGGALSHSSSHVILSCTVEQFFLLLWNSTYAMSVSFFKMKIQHRKFENMYD